MMRRFTSAPNPCARVFAYMSQVAVSRGAKPVARAVVARQVRRRFAGAMHVVHRHRQVLVRQAHLDDRAPSRVLLDGGEDRRGHVAREVLVKYSCGTPMRRPFTPRASAPA
jgi:hypothetical protein